MGSQLQWKIAPKPEFFPLIIARFARKEHRRQTRYPLS